MIKLILRIILFSFLHRTDTDFLGLPFLFTQHLVRISPCSPLPIIIIRLCQSAFFRCLDAAALYEDCRADSRQDRNDDLNDFVNSLLFHTSYLLLLTSYI